MPLTCEQPRLLVYTWGPPFELRLRRTRPLENVARPERVLPRRWATRMPFEVPPKRAFEVATIR
jgi:hypothetical protein